MVPKVLGIKFLTSLGVMMVVLVMNIWWVTHFTNVLSMQLFDRLEIQILQPCLSVFGCHREYSDFVF